MQSLRTPNEPSLRHAAPPASRVRPSIPQGPDRATRAQGPCRVLGDQDDRLRTIWISDVHLGTRGCKAEALLDFLAQHPADRIYLVGDIVDGWSLRKGWYWTEQHSAVLREFLRRDAEGAEVVYVCGNHDEFLRRWIGLPLGGIQVVDEAVHVTGEGKRLLVLHGDRFDMTMRHARWLAHLGDRAYQLALVANDGLAWVRRRLGRPYWSLSAWLKRRVKQAVAYVDGFENMLIDHAKRRGFDGVVCGHIHHAELREVNGILYANDGDWVESCTALVEHPDGRLELIDWAAHLRDEAARKVEAERAAEAQPTAAVAG